PQFLSEDRFNARPQIRPGNPRDAGDGHWYRQPTDGQNALGVIEGLIPAREDGLITCALALVDQLPFDPPYEWMEPKERLDEHVARRGDIVVTADMATRVRDDSLHLCGWHAPKEPPRQRQDRAPYTDDAWLERAGRR